MAGSITVTIKKNNLDRATPELKAMMRNALDKFKFDVEAHAGALVPVDTGTLKNSLSSQQSDNELTMRWEAPYAGYIEFGTRHMAPQPYVTPAVEMAEPGLQAAVNEIAARLGG